MAINPNTNFTAGAILTADQMNRFPRGVMGQVTKTSNYTLTAVDTLIPTMSITFTAEANRVYVGHFKSLITKSVAPGLTATSMNKVVSGVSTTLGVSVVTSSTSTAVDEHILTVPILGLAAGSVTIEVLAAYVDNGGTLTASATNIMFFYVEDLGPA
jgi:hypothetical protein